MEDSKDQIGVSVTESDGSTIVLRQVRDSFDHTHIIKSEISRGGQGIVCFTENDDFVIKLTMDSTGNVISKEKDPQKFKQIDNEIRNITFKPFPDKLHLAYPIARLTEYSGYVMRLMGDMTEYASLVPYSTEEISRMSTDGGHRRRFELLSKLAALLAKLHNGGFVYCDLSPRNAFVTKDPELNTQNVWLIDADNVFMPGEDADKLVYTQRYAAPELLSNKSCSQASDCYSFATLAFESLAANHPFKGDKAEGNDDGKAWDAESKPTSTPPDIPPEYSGQIPWIEDIEDDSNHTDAGLPRQNFLTDETFRLFNATFCEEGREKPSSRPTAVLWARAFAHSYAQSVRCAKQDCNMSFVYSDKQKKCPWCNSILSPIFTLSRNDQIVFAHEAVYAPDKKGEWFALNEFLFCPFALDTYFRPKLWARSVENAEGRGIEFKIQKRPEETFSIFIQAGESPETEITAHYTLMLAEGAEYALRYTDEKKGLDRTYVLRVVTPNGKESK